MEISHVQIVLFLNLRASIICAIMQAPTIAAAAYLRLAGRSAVPPCNNLSYSENFLYMLDSL